MNRALALVLFIAIAGSSFGQSTFEPLAGPIRAQALALPAETPLVVLTPADQARPRQAYTLRRTFSADGTFTVEAVGAAVSSVQTFRPNGTLLTSRQADPVKKLTLSATVSPGRTTVQTIITTDGKVKSDKKADLKPGIVLRDELQHLILQAWQYGVRDGLKFQSLSPDGGMVGDFQIVFVPTANPLGLSDKYTYPDEFRAVLEAKSNYLVADMSLQGVAAFFFPHHFYLIYTVTPAGLEFRAYFGEDPKSPVYQYVKK